MSPTFASGREPAGGTEVDEHARMPAIDRVLRRAGGRGLAVAAVQDHDRLAGERVDGEVALPRVLDRERHVLEDGLPLGVRGDQDHRTRRTARLHTRR